MLNSLEDAASEVGLNINEGKTQFMTSNVTGPKTSTSKSGKDLKEVADFVYPGAWVGSTDHEFKVRKAKAWSACHKMKKIWKSKLRRNLKIRLFQATVESILLYGSDTWTITQSLSKKIDGCYTRMLRMALNVDWRLHISNAAVYGSLPKVTTKIRQRRMKLAGHIQRHDDLMAHNLLLWEPVHGHRGRGRPHVTFVDTLRRDTELTSTEEIGRLMNDRDMWRDRIYGRA